MKLTSRYKNPLPEFVAHGVKEIGGDTYILKVDLSGTAIIQKVNSTNTEIFFTRLLSGSIPDFWNDPTIHVYTYIHKL